MIKQNDKHNIQHTKHGNGNDIPKPNNNTIHRNENKKHGVKKNDTMSKMRIQMDNKKHPYICKLPIMSPKNKGEHKMNEKDFKESIKYYDITKEAIIIRSKLMKASDFKPISRNTDEL